MGAAQSQPRLYWPLGKRQIRLLSIDRSDPVTETISCRLTTHDLDGAPPYHALSYVWGDPKMTSTVLINGTPVQKTVNLVAALRRLRELDEAYYWIDAICINQQDNAEKSAQVQMMEEIYGKAVEATAWLGEGTDDSELAMTFLSQWTTAGHAYMTLRSQTRRNFTAPTGDEREQLMLALERTSDWRDNILGILRTIPNPCGVAEWQALAHLFERPYWKRIWIIQELTLSRKVTLRCGPSQCKFFTFIPVVQLMLLADQRNLWAYFGLENLDGLNLHMGVVWAGMQPTIWTAGGAGSISNHNLPRILQMTASTLATDPRDKVYALLSLVPPERTVIEVDYNRSVAKVYVDFVLSEIQVTGSLAPLYMLQDMKSRRTTKGLPSWAPELHSDTSYLSYLDGMTNDGFYAAGDSKASYSYKSRWGRKTLSVRGVRCCAIAQVEKGADLGMDLSEDDVVAEVLPRWFALATSRPASQEAVVSTDRGFNQAQTFFRTIIHDDSNTGPPHYQPRGEADDVKDPGDMAMSYTAWQTRQEPGKRLPLLASDMLPFLSCFPTVLGPDNTPLLIDDSGPPADMAIVTNIDIVAMKAQNFVNAMLRLAITSSFFVCQNGQMGTGPKDAQPGDVVCVLLGADIPLLLRPKGRYYTVVGPCYVCGIMYGQLLEEAEKGLRQFETFKLR